MDAEPVRFRWRSRKIDTESFPFVQEFCKRLRNADTSYEQMEMFEQLAKNAPECFAIEGANYGRLKRCLVSTVRALSKRISKDVSRAVGHEEVLSRSIDSVERVLALLNSPLTSDPLRSAAVKIGECLKTLARALRKTSSTRVRLTILDAANRLLKPTCSTKGRIVRFDSSEKTLFSAIESMVACALDVLSSYATNSTDDVTLERPQHTTAAMALVYLLAAEAQGSGAAVIATADTKRKEGEEEDVARSLLLESFPRSVLLDRFFRIEKGPSTLASSRRRDRAAFSVVSAVAIARALCATSPATRANGPAFVVQVKSIWCVIKRAVRDHKSRVRWHGLAASQSMLKRLSVSIHLDRVAYPRLFVESDVACDIVHDLLPLLLENWEHPVKSIKCLVPSIFKIALSVLLEASKEKEEERRVGWLVKTLLRRPDSSRAKYSALGILLTLRPSSLSIVRNAFEDFATSMFDAIADPKAAASAISSFLVTTIVDSGCKGSTSWWWMRGLCGALTNVSRSYRVRVTSHFLPTLFKAIERRRRRGAGGGRHVRRRRAAVSTIDDGDGRSAKRRAVDVAKAEKGSTENDSDKVDMVRYMLTQLRQWVRRREDGETLQETTGKRSSDADEYYTRYLRAILAILKEARASAWPGTETFDTFVNLSRDSSPSDVSSLFDMTVAPSTTSSSSSSTPGFIDMTTLHTALRHREADVRLLALELVCASPRISTSLHELEIRCILLALRIGAKTYSSEYRNKAVPQISKMLRRCVADKSDEAAAKRFFESLVESLRGHLYPGAPHARCSLAVDLLVRCQDVLEISRQQKGRKRSASLGARVRDSDTFDAILTDNLGDTMACMLWSKFDDIRANAFRFMRRFLRARPLYASARCVAFLRRADRLVRSSRVYEVVGGAYVYRLLSHKASDAVSCLTDLTRVVEERVDALSTTASAGVPLSISLDELPGRLRAMREVIREIESIGVAGKEHIFKSAWTVGMNALKCSLRVIGAGEDRALDDFVISKQVRGGSSQDTVKDGGSRNSGEGQYRADAVLVATDCRGCSAALASFEDGAAAYVSALDAQQRRVTSAWLTAKEAAGILAAIMSLRLTSAAVGGANLLSRQVDEMNEMIRLILHTLLRAKHQGAVAKTAEALEIIGLKLAQHDASKMRALPAQWIEFLLSRDRIAREFFVLRRSAGLAAAIRALVKAAPARYAPKAVASLLAFAQLRESEWRLRVHALNLLRELLGDAETANAMTESLPRIFEISVVGFASRNWAVRNSSTMVFASVMRCMLREDYCVPFSNSCGMSFGAFFRRCPSLLTFLETRILTRSDEVDTDDSRIEALVPFPALLLLSRLWPDDSTFYADDAVFQQASKLRTRLGGLLTDVQLPIRIAASRAFAALVPRESLVAVASDVVRTIPANSNRRPIRQNHLHGALLATRQLISVASDVFRSTVSDRRRAAIPRDDDELDMLNMQCRKLSALLSDRISYLFDDSYCCDTIRSATFDVVSSLRDVYSRVCVDEEGTIEFDRLWSKLHDEIFDWIRKTYEGRTKDHLASRRAAPFLRKAVEMLWTRAAQDGNFERRDDPRASFLAAILNVNVASRIQKTVYEASIRAIRACIQTECGAKCLSFVQQFLYQSFRDLVAKAPCNDVNDCLSATAEILCEVVETSSTRSQSSIVVRKILDPPHTVLDLWSRLKRYAGRRAILCLFATSYAAWQAFGSDELCDEEVERWFRLLRASVDDTSPLEMRLAVADALQISRLLSVASSSRARVPVYKVYKRYYEEDAMEAWKIMLNLLDDDDAAVRRRAAKIVTAALNLSAFPRSDTLRDAIIAGMSKTLSRTSSIPRCHDTNECDDHADKIAMSLCFATFAGDPGRLRSARVSWASYLVSSIRSCGKSFLKIEASYSRRRLFEKERANEHFESMFRFNAIIDMAANLALDAQEGQHDSTLLHIICAHIAKDLSSFLYSAGSLSFMKKALGNESVSTGDDDIFLASYRLIRSAHFVRRISAVTAEQEAADKALKCVREAFTTAKSRGFVVHPILLDALA